MVNTLEPLNMAKTKQQMDNAVSYLFNIVEYLDAKEPAGGWKPANRVIFKNGNILDVHQAARYTSANKCC